MTAARRRPAAPFIVFVAVLACGGVRAADSPCASLAKDLAFIRGQLQEHSSPYNHDAAVRERTDRAFEEAIAKAGWCRTNADYGAAVQGYLASFRDPHLRASRLPPAERLSTNVWIRRLNDRYFVWNSIGEAPYGLGRGDEWLGCQGRAPRDILIQDVLSLRGHAALEASLYESAQAAFVRKDKAGGEKLDCEFRRGGRAVAKTMEWGAFDEPSFKRLEDELEKRPSYALTKEPWGYWVALSGMMTRSEDDLKAMRAFVRDAGRLRGARTIVLDLRRNGGGDSAWGDRWIEALYGAKPETEEETGSECLLWATPENLRNFRDFASKALKEARPGSRNAGSLRRTLDWLSGDKRGFIECGYKEDHPKPRSRKPPKPRYKGKLYVLTDAACFSSCEMFVMALRGLPGVVHVGVATNASTLYGDVRDVQAPSGNAGVMFPQKVFAMASLWKGRKPGEAIAPAIPLEYDPAREAAGRDTLRDAVLDLLARDGRL